MKRALVLGIVLSSMGIASCAMWSPPISGVFIAPEGPSSNAKSQVALALVGDIGIPNANAAEIAQGVGARLSGSPDAPVLVLGDVFYSDGLLGMCPAGGVESNLRCKDSGHPRAQFQSVMGPLQQSLAGNPVVAIAGNHDHYGDPVATDNACSIFPETPGWRYVADGCGLDVRSPVLLLETPHVWIAILDTQRMINDPAFREAGLRELESALARAKSEAPERWRVVASHHPLETYGSHNGASIGTAIHKDLYLLRKTALWPLSTVVEATLLARAGEQDVYELKYRAFRRGLYRVFERTPVDMIVSGHDHSLQWIELGHPGVGYQAVVGAGGPRSRVKRFGLDLLWTNRLARAAGLADVVPAHPHRLLFGAGGPGRRDGRSGRGYAVVSVDAGELAVEFYDASSPTPLYVASLSR